MRKKEFIESLERIECKPDGIGYNRPTLEILKKFLHKNTQMAHEEINPYHFLHFIFKNKCWLTVADFYKGPGRYSTERGLALEIFLESFLSPHAGKRLLLGQADFITHVKQQCKETTYNKPSSFDYLLTVYWCLLEEELKPFINELPQMIKKALNNPPADQNFLEVISLITNEIQQLTAKKSKSETKILIECLSLCLSFKCQLNDSKSLSFTNLFATSKTTTPTHHPHKSLP